MADHCVDLHYLEIRRPEGSFSLGALQPRAFESLCV